MSKRLVVVLAVVWMVVLVAGIASSLTLSLCGVTMGDTASADTGRNRVVVSGEQYEMIERYSRLQQVLEIIQDEYYLEADEETLMTGALRGMMSALEDPYTFYYTPEEMAESTEHQNGSYVGVGLQVIGTEDGEMLITRSFKDSSAYEQGLCAGDVIEAVNGEPVSAENAQVMDEAIDKIIGEEGTEVTLTIDREGVKMDFVLERRKINMNRVEYMMLEDQIGYIILYEFMGDDVEGFEKAVADLQKSGAKGLILDVRSNPGGLLEDVVKICDILLPDSIVLYIENRAGERENFYSDDKMLGLPLAVLVNDMSASASEVLAGAVQDTGVGTIIGETTFGKGIVQTIIPFIADGAGLQLTTSRYYTPNGRSIHGIGITPDIVVDDEGYDFTSSQPDPDKDAQLKKAIEVIRKEINP